MAVLPLRAQFFMNGSDPASVRWSQINTADYRIVYPRGMDSLARKYALNLERVKLSVGKTAGYIPNEKYSNRMPVILHTQNRVPNGMVVWAPRRMELYTTPEALGGVPMDWSQQLVIHESRHVAQLQYLNDYWLKPYGWLSGQLIPGILTTIFCGPAFFEGDAVSAETALTPSGRGRAADFLGYYRVSFLAGERRDFWKWRYGSQRYFTPSYYAAGYLMNAGIRAVYNEPNFTARYYDRLMHKSPFFVFQNTIKDISGKNLKNTFTEVCDSLMASWDREYVPAWSLPEEITPAPARYKIYTNSFEIGGKLYALRSGIQHSKEFIEVRRDGSERRIASIAPSVIRLKADSAHGLIYFSEINADPRWEMRSYSNIYCIDTLGRRRKISDKTAWYNPSPSPDGTRLSVTSYAEDARTSVCVIDLEGKVLKEYKAPDGMQVLESEWVGDRLFASAITTKGSGIYEVGSWRTVVGPSFVKISSLREHRGKISYICDRNGSGKALLQDPDSDKEILLVTTFGSTVDYNYTDQGDSIVFTWSRLPGKLLYKRAVEDSGEKLRFEKYPFADKLTAQETQPIDWNAEAEVSQPKNYSKAGHLFRLHSWLPFYLDVDALKSLSLETIENNAGLGASVYFQNDLSTFQAFFGWHAKPGDPNWRHSGRTRITYSGLYPVFEFLGTVNEATAVKQTITEEEGVKKIKTESQGIAQWSGTLSAYIPFNFTSGGHIRGLVPKISASLSNNILEAEDYSQRYLGKYTASIRGYSMLTTPSSCLYPRWGIGAEAGFSGRFASEALISPNWYVYAYGYVPGFWRSHGVKLSARYTDVVREGCFTEVYASATPRGYSGNMNLSAFPRQSLFTADYVFPFAPLDFSGFCPVTYIRNLEGGVHCDLGLYNGLSSENLVSVGCSLKVRLENLLWLPYTTRIGVTYSYNCGSAYSLTNMKSPHAVSLVFSVAL